MRKAATLLSFIIFQNLYTLSYAQLLDSTALEKQTVYSSYDEAMKEPLKVYKLSIQNPGYVPANIDTLKNLQSLTLYGNDWDSNLNELPASFDKLGNLQILLIYNTDLKALRPQIKTLQNLKMISCPNITVLPKDLGALKNLESLELYQVDDMPSGFSDLTKLKTLLIYKSKNIPSNNYLTKLSVSSRMLINVLDPSLFPAINELTLLPNSYYYEPDFPSDSLKMAIERAALFSQLKKLDLFQVNLNNEIWESILKIKNLENLKLNYSSKIPDNIALLQKLKKLSFIADSANCAAAGKLPALEEIETTTVTHQLSKLKGLKKVTIISTEEISNMPSTATIISIVAKLPLLEEIKGLDLSSTTLPTALSKLKSLRSIDLTISLNLFDHDKITSTFELLAQYPKLETLTIPWIGLPEQISKLKTLKTLLIKYDVYNKPFTESDKLKLSLLLPKTILQYQPY